MAFLRHIAAYAAALVVETAVLPGFLGAAAPPLSLPVLLAGVVSVRFGDALALASAAGIMRDSLAPAGSLPHTLSFIATALFVHGVLAATDWEEPLRRVAAYLIALAAAPAAGWASGVIVEIGGWLPPSSPASVYGPWSPGLTAALAAWFLLYAVLVVRRFRARDRGWGRRRMVLSP